MAPTPEIPAEPWRRIAYKLGRHLDQADAMPASTWSAKGQELLLQLRAFDPSRYDREIPPKRRRGQGERPALAESCPG